VDIIGYLPEEAASIGRARSSIPSCNFAALKGLHEREAKASGLIKWLERFGLKDSAHRKVEELSKSNQQKVPTDYLTPARPSS